MVEIASPYLVPGSPRPASYASTPKAPAPPPQPHIAGIVRSRPPSFVALGGISNASSQPKGNNGVPAPLVQYSPGYPGGLCGARSASSLTGASTPAPSGTLSQGAAHVHQHARVQYRSPAEVQRARDGRASVPTPAPSFMMQQHSASAWKATTPVSPSGMSSASSSQAAWIHGSLPASARPCMHPVQSRMPNQASGRAIADDMSIAFMPYFLIKDMDPFLEVCQQCMEQVKLETLCLSFGVAINRGPHSDMAFCRELYASAEGVIAHLMNIEMLFKEGLCKYGELVSLQIHGPKEELDKLRDDPIVQEMDPEFFELLPGSFEIVELPNPMPTLVEARSLAATRQSSVRAFPQYPPAQSPNRGMSRPTHPAQMFQEPPLVPAPTRR
mmetsp:Transcript_58921/g.140636  ORF Transcript_58921/g.140636 Transcript_58921/m.140636 type:complete len:385 (-) Transcript_58921:107-1261(-)